MRAPRTDDRYRTAHARLDRLRAHLQTSAPRELVSSMEAISAVLDELMVLSTGGGAPSRAAVHAVHCLVERLSVHCAVLEDALEEQNLTRDVRRGVTGVVEACADIATSAMELPAVAAAHVA